ncbi:hypothetical protein EYF80_008125 [Liparis tanakae]|uniref:Uncharacterized protein n=1 Tax=Liparis tanakae TaxID=230148 RepID=A0A4Z2IUJ1_9TELE|nr:hypothetical protein EYF80_008125 [Liparis tanakae]
MGRFFSAVDPSLVDKERWAAVKHPGSHWESSVSLMGLMGRAGMEAGAEAAVPLGVYSFCPVLTALEVTGWSLCIVGRMRRVCWEGSKGQEEREGGRRVVWREWWCEEREGGEG